MSAHSFTPNGARNRRPAAFCASAIRRSRPNACCKYIWHHQRLRRDLLRTLDGQPVRVLHPGFWNHEAGPDFRGALLQFGQDAPCSGDIEIDVLPQNWQAHQHDRNPAFAQVILHVVWTGGPAASAPAPALALEEFLDMPLNEMQLWALSGAAERWPESLRGACSAPLAQLLPEQRDDLLRQAALVRFERKAGELEHRARHAGWEQALWEGLFRALGYKQNVWAMQRVAEVLPHLREGTDSLLAWQARLLGVSGFLSRRPAGRRQRTGRVCARRCGTTGGASASASATCCCPKNSGACTACARPINRNGVWLWRRTGWHRGISLPE